MEGLTVTLIAVLALAVVSAIALSVRVAPTSRSRLLDDKLRVQASRHSHADFDASQVPMRPSSLDL